MATVYLIDLTHNHRRGGSGVALRSPPRAWTCAAEVAGCTSDDEVRRAWQAATHTSRDGALCLHDNNDNDDVRRYRRVRYGDGVAVANRYFAVHLQLEVVYREHDDDDDDDTNDVRTGAHDTMTAAAQRMVHRLLLPPPPLSSLPSADAHDDDDDKVTARGCVFVVCASQDTDVVPWHLLDAAALLFCVVLVYDDDDDDGDDKAAAAAWRDACVEHRVEYVMHTSQRQVVPRHVARAGLLSGALSGSARLLQLLSNTLWPAPLRLPLSTTTATSTATTTSAPAQTHSCDDNDNDNAFLVVVDDDAAAALRCFVATSDVPCMDVRFYTRACGSDDDDASSSKASHASSSSSRLLPPPPLQQLLLVNRYYVACVSPHVVCARDLVRDAEATTTTRAYALAYVFWPLSSAAHAHDGAATSDAAALSSIVTCLRRRGVRDVKLVDTTTTTAATTTLQEGEAAATAWRRVCAQHDVEVIALASTARSHSSSRNDDDDAATTTGSNRLRETLHCVTWPVCLPRTHAHAQLQQQQQQDDDAGSVGDTLVNRLRVCAYCGQTRCSSTSAADDEEAMLRDVFAHALPPLQEQLHDAIDARATTTATATARLCAMRSVPSLYANEPRTLRCAWPSFVVRNRYFDASVRVCCDGGVYARQQHARGVAHHCSSADVDNTSGNMAVCGRSSSSSNDDRLDDCDAMLLVCDRATLHAAAAASNDDDDDARVRDLRAALRALQQRMTRDVSADVEHDNENKCSSSSSTATALLGLVYCVDVHYADEAAMMAVLRDVRRIVQPQHTAAHDDDDDNDDDDIGPAFELVWSANARDDDDDDGGRGSVSATAEGSARIREALLQHAWPRRRMHTDTRTAKATTTATTTTTTTAESAVHATTAADTCASVMRTANDADVVALSTCALPPSYLVDPLTLRSIAVPALQRLSSSSHEHAHERERSRLHKELLCWVQKMQRHGDRLPWQTRKQQAEQLALALDTAW